MPIRAVIFDLDGTLLDSLADIAESVNTVLAEHGLATHPLPAYRSFVGDGMTMLIRRVGDGMTMLIRRVVPDRLRDDDSTVAAFVKRLKEVYGGRSDRLTKPYDGIAGLLDALEGQGIAMAVLSNKPHELTVGLVGRLLGAWKFSPVYGERPPVPRKPDPSAALAIASELGLAPQDILYVGDTPTDIATARAAGMPALAAAWGFRSEAELRAAGATRIAHHPSDVLAHLGA
jgi:phosphoglycolate phosphatase